MSANPRVAKTPPIKTLNEATLDSNTSKSCRKLYGIGSVLCDSLYALRSCWLAPVLAWSFP